MSVRRFSDVLRELERTSVNTEKVPVPPLTSPHLFHSLLISSHIMVIEERGPVNGCLLEAFLVMQKAGFSRPMWLY
jgi:hypothetical protein